MMVFSDTINVMLLTHDKFRQFTTKRIADAHETVQVLLALSCDGREGVDDITEKALAAGGRETREKQDHGLMYGRAFEDPDGHTWEPMWMDVAAAAQAMAQPSRRLSRGPCAAGGIVAALNLSYTGRRRTAPEAGAHACPTAATRTAASSGTSC